MTKFEMGDDFKFRIGDQDLSGYVNRVEQKPGAEDQGTWGEKLAGLQSGSMQITLDNSDGAFMPHTAALFFPAPKPLVRVTREVPDGRWQSFKWRLRSRFPLLRRLKVRCRLYSFDASLEPWQRGDEFGLSGTTTGPVTMGIEER